MVVILENDMGAAVVQKKGLGQLLEGLSPTQKSFLCSLVVGFSVPDASKFAGVKANAVYGWRCNNNGFKEVENLIKADRGRYLRDALGIYIDSCGLKSLEGLGQVLKMGDRWDKLSREDKTFLMQARIFFARRVLDGGNSPSSYEDDIMKKHGGG